MGVLVVATDSAGDRESLGLSGEIGAIRNLALDGFAVAAIPRGGAASARGVFPFGLAQQPLVLAGLAGQPLDIGLAVVPVHANDGMAAGLPEGVAPINSLFDREGLAIPMLAGPRAWQGTRPAQHRSRATEAASVCMDSSCSDANGRTPSSFTIGR